MTRTPAGVLPRSRRVGPADAGRARTRPCAAGPGGALLAWDGQPDDDARLVVAVARTAAAAGARVLTGVVARRAAPGDGELVAGRARLGRPGSRTVSDLLDRRTRLGLRPAVRAPPHCRPRGARRSGSAQDLTRAPRAAPRPGMMSGPMSVPEYETRPEGDPESVVRALLDRPPVTVRLLEAARGCVLDRGISRVTMSDVARRADLSRTTLYRHYPDVETVLRDLMTLDFGRAVLAASHAVTDRPTARERLAGTLVEGCRAMRADDLFRKILDVDPEFLLPYVTARTGASQRVMLTLLEDGVRRGQEDDGSIRAGDTLTIAQLLLVQAQALAVSIGIVAGDDPERERALLALADESFEAQLRPR